MSDVPILSGVFLALATFLAGFVDSIAGGGGLISLASYYAAGLPPLYAIGNNKFSSTFGTVVAAIEYGRKGKILWKSAVLSAAAALVGSSIGAEFALRYSDRVFLYMLIIILPILSVLTIRKPKVEGRTFSDYAVLALSSAVSFAVGMYDGFFGPGTGMLLTLGFSFIGFPLINAAGNTRIVNAASNIAALAAFIANGNIIYSIGIPCAITSILGNALGAHYAIRKGDRAIRPLLIVVLALLYIRVIYSIFV